MVAEVGATVVACTLPVCVVVVVVEGAVATTVAGAGVVEEAAAGLLLTALPTLAAVAALSWHCCVLLLQTWDELEQQLAPQAICTAAARQCLQLHVSSTHATHALQCLQHHAHESVLIAVMGWRQVHGASPTCSIKKSGAKCSWLSHIVHCPLLCGQFTCVLLLHLPALLRNSLVLCQCWHHCFEVHCQHGIIQIASPGWSCSSTSWWWGCRKTVQSCRWCCHRHCCLWGRTGC